jgi:hypothetical protein
LYRRWQFQGLHGNVLRIMAKSTSGDFMAAAACEDYGKQLLAAVSLTVTTALTTILLLSAELPLPAPASEKIYTKTEVHGKKVITSVLIDAPPETVFNVIRSQRTSGPGIRKLLLLEGTHAVVEERFWHLPIIGTAICTYEELEQPYSRIDYKMIRSDKLKRFEGFWLLSPKDSGQHTLATLSLLCDTGINIPFSDQITASRIKPAVWKRLSAVKTASEKK